MEGVLFLSLLGGYCCLCRVHACVGEVTRGYWGTLFVHSVMSSWRMLSVDTV